MTTNKLTIAVAAVAILLISATARFNPNVYHESWITYIGTVHTNKHFALPALDSIPDSELGIRKILKTGEWRAAFPHPEACGSQVTQRAGRIFSAGTDEEAAQLDALVSEIESHQ